MHPTIGDIRKSPDGDHYETLRAKGSEIGEQWVPAATYAVKFRVPWPKETDGRNLYDLLLLEGWKPPSNSSAQLTDEFLLSELKAVEEVFSNATDYFEYFDRADSLRQGNRESFKFSPLLYQMAASRIKLQALRVRLEHGHRSVY